METSLRHPPVGVATRQSESSDTIQLVSFQLADEEYCIEITQVQEIILIGEITRLPHAPAYIPGVINLRSTIIPVIDLHRRFEITSPPKEAERRIMVVNLAGKTVGLMVDAVTEVMRVPRDVIAPPPTNSAELGQDYLTGLVQLGDRLLTLLDVDQMLREEISRETELSGCHLVR